MKKIILNSIALMFCALSYGQDTHQHDVFNKNMTPFNDAAETLNGTSAANLLREAAWKGFIAKYPTWGARFNAKTQLPHRAFGHPISFAPGGSDPVAKAKAFIQSELHAYGINTDELQLTRNVNDGKYIHVDFKQIHEGYEVLWSRVSVRFSQNLNIIMFGTDFYRNIPVVHATLSSTQAVGFAESAINTKIIHSEVDPSLKWFPLPTDKGLDFRLAYQITVNTQDDNITPGRYVTYVDANSGQILYRQNKVLNAGFKVKGDIYPINLASPQVSMPLPNLKVVQGSTTYYTDANGDVTLPTSGPWNPTITLEGKWSKVVSGTNGTTTAVINPTNVANGDSITFPVAITDCSERHINAYYHVNEIHDFMKSKFPSFTVMDNPLTTRVDRTDGNCNAFYNGTSINFYTTANGCNALSYIADVVYHEYGHGISDKFWTAQGSSFDNGGMGEGYSDVWAMGIIKTPIVGGGFLINAPSSYIRRYDLVPKVYPQDITGEVHDDGEIIAGAWWDVAVNLSATMPLSQAVDTMSDIFAGSQFGLATGPDGTEGQVYFDILIDALQYDDDNNNLNDGTPHFLQIVKAFARHGIFLLSDSKVNNLNETVYAAGSSFPVNADVIASFPAFVGNVKMFYRLKTVGTTDSLTLTKVNNVYTANFPSSVAGEIYEYYYVVEDIMDVKSAFSPIAPEFTTTFSQRNIPYYFTIGYIPISHVDFENTLTDWTIGNYTGDNATAGKWVVATPIASIVNGDTVQTGKDHTTGTGKCAVTGNATSASSQIGSADIDNGKTTLLSQEFDFTGYTKPILSYWRWFTNSQSPTSAGRKDRWIVYIVYTGSSSMLVERTFQPDVQWRRNIVPVDLTKGTKARLMFIAEDSVQNGAGTVVEAAVDDVEILDLGSYPAGTSNLNEMVLNVYPNPAQQDVSIRSAEKGEMLITLYNAVGSVVKSMKVEQFNNEYRFQTDGLSNGIYMMKMEINHHVAQQTLTISK